MFVRCTINSGKAMCRATMAACALARNINIAGPSDERRRRLVEKFSVVEDPFVETTSTETNWRAMNFVASTTQLNTVVRDIRLTTDKHMLVRNVRLADRWFSLHDYPTGRFVRDLVDAETMGQKPMNAAFFDEGRKLVIHYENDVVVVWDLESGAACRTFRFEKSGRLRHNHRSIFRDNKMLWCVGRSRLEVYDLNNGHQKATYECAQPSIGDIRFDGRLLALHLDGGPVHVLDVVDGTRRQVHFLGDTTAPMGVTIGLVSELDQIFVKTGENVHVHDVVTGEHLGTWNNHRGPLPAWNYFHGRMFGVFDLNQVFIHRFNGHAWSNSLQTFDFPISPVGFVNEKLFLTTTAEHNNPANKSVFQLWDMDRGAVVGQMERGWSQTLSVHLTPNALDVITNDEGSDANILRHFNFNH